MLVARHAWHARHARLALVASLGLIAASAGCATTTRYAAQLDAWTGRDASELVAAWGEPDAARATADGNTALRWSRTRVSTRPTPTKAITTGHPTSADAFARRTTIDRCDTTFIVAPSGRILASHSTGSACVAR